MSISDEELATQMQQRSRSLDAWAQRRLRSELYDLVAVQFGDRPVVVAYDVDLYVGQRTAVV